MTPFEKAGYTKDTKFKVLRDSNACFSKGDIVTLAEDDGFRCPWFKTEDGRESCSLLPGMAPEGYDENLEVYKEPKKLLTPFQEAGYTKDTKFKLLRDWGGLKKGDIVKLWDDDGGSYCNFKTEDGRLGLLCLPNMTPRGVKEELEVYEEPKKELTPFEKAGYTKDTKFKLLRSYGSFEEGDIVTLKLDDGTVCPIFKTKDDRDVSMWLPDMAPLWDELEVYEEPKKLLTPFQEAGYTKDTKFKLLRSIDCGDYKVYKGTIVTLRHDDGNKILSFNTKDNIDLFLYLPNTAHQDGDPEDLEVYEGTTSDSKVKTERSNLIKVINDLKTQLDEILRSIDND